MQVLGRWHVIMYREYNALFPLAVPQHLHMHAHRNVCVREIFSASHVCCGGMATPASPRRRPRHEHRYRSAQDDAPRKPCARVSTRTGARQECYIPPRTHTAREMGVPRVVDQLRVIAQLAWATDTHVPVDDASWRVHAVSPPRHNHALANVQSEFFL